MHTGEGLDCRNDAGDDPSPEIIRLVTRVSEQVGRPLVGKTARGHERMRSESTHVNRGGDRSRAMEAEAERQPWKTPRGKVASAGLLHQRDVGRRETVGSRQDERETVALGGLERGGRAARDSIERVSSPDDASTRCNRGREGRRHAGVPRGSVTLQKL